MTVTLAESDMPDETKRGNPFADGLDEWERPLGPRFRSAEVTETKGAIRNRGAAGAPAGEDARTPDAGERFRQGLEDWENPFGERR